MKRFPLLAMCVLGWCLGRAIGDAARCCAAESGRLIDHPTEGVRLAEGFAIHEIAGPELANDIWSMTFDPRGQIVVSGPGYIRILHDSNGDGLLDDATLFAKHPGAMGLCFNETGSELLVMGGGWLARFRDEDHNGVGDGSAENLLPFAAGEHGGHAIRQGPDGWWNVIGGNDAGIDGRHNTAPHRVIQKVEAGALLRISPDLKQSQVIAHGFRNPYDFDFNALGDVFTYDSDTERDYFLPWYSPCRIYQVQFAQHHGWRLKGFQRSLRRCDDYPDVAPSLTPLGRGSPTGVVCYRHLQFPEAYRDGIFACDWTFGRIHFVALARRGAGYIATARTFLEPIGMHGFAPTDCAVAPDGSLIVSIGGRKTRGAVYRISYRNENETRPVAVESNNRSSAVDEVLRAPQPLEAWSRARWMPKARALQRTAFESAAHDSGRTQRERIRAIEILTELFGGCDPGESFIDESGEVEARRIWSLAVHRHPVEAAPRNGADATPAVVLAARAEAAIALPRGKVEKINSLALRSDDRRVRNAAETALEAALAQTADKEGIVDSISTEEDHRSGKTELALIRAQLDPNAATVSLPALTRIVRILAALRSNDLRLEALRLVQLALGDWRVDSPAAEAFSAYEARLELSRDQPLRTELLRAVRPLIRRDFGRVAEEAARVCAMLRDEDVDVPGRVSGMIDTESSATSDFHFLAVLARLGGELPETHGAQLAAAIIGLDRKLAGGDRRPKQNWPVRLAEVVAALVQRQPLLADRLLQAPEFATGARLTLVPSLGVTSRERAARLYLAAIKAQPDFEWSPALVALLRTLPPTDVDELIKTRTPKTPPAATRRMNAEEIARWEKLLDTVAWEQGNAARGAELFTQRSCATCHGAPVAFGPDLAGVARRFSPRDLLRGIVFPSRDVAETYRATDFKLRDGAVRRGVVAFYSADGVIVQTGPGLTERIAESDIVSQEPSSLSLMPEGLLEGLTAQEVADLYKYLATL
jgi:putative membrane-bound dehydrogenase-like protein